MLKTGRLEVAKLGVEHKSVVSSSQHVGHHPSELANAVCLVFQVYMHMCVICRSFIVVTIKSTKLIFPIIFAIQYTLYPASYNTTFFKVWSMRQMHHNPMGSLSEVPIPGPQSRPPESELGERGCSFKNPAIDANSFWSLRTSTVGQYAGLELGGLWEFLIGQIRASDVSWVVSHFARCC